MIADRRAMGSVLALVAMVLALYGRVAGHEFVNYDDPVHLWGNPVVNQGVTLASLRDAFLTAPASNWQPLTWISHMVVWEFAADRPGPHLLVNVILHALNAVLLLGAFHALTRRWGPSLFVAFVFAVHPLRVESVAWAVERKDVLSGAFFLLGLWAYARYARRPDPRSMLPVAVAFTLGLLAKPMLVTMPLVFLLLDIWPLQREASWTRRLLEKMPLFALAAVVSTVTLLAQRSAVREFDAVPLGDRLANAALSVWQYVGKALWPADLAVFYPFPSGFEGWRVGLAVAALVLVTAGAWWRVRRWPALAMGWTWYLVTLLPVVGIVTVGNQALADRYTYLPHIGLAVVAAWCAGGALRRVGSHAAVGVAAASIVGYGVVTWAQVGVWSDSRTLFEHALAVTESNHVAHLNLGVVEMEADDLDAARTHFEAVLRIEPAHPYAENNLGLVALRNHEVDRAAAHFERAVERKPDYADAWDNLGQALERRGDVEGAARHYRRALSVQADHRTSLHHLGALLGRLGQFEEALPLLHRVLEIDPSSADAWTNLGHVHFGQDDLDGAQAAYTRAVELVEAPEALYPLGLIHARRGNEAVAVALLRRAAESPSASPNVLAAVAWRLATHPAAGLRDGPAALGYAQEAVRRTERADARALAALAAACAELDRYDDAVVWQQRALEKAPPAARAELEDALRVYREGRPLRVP